MKKVGDFQLTKLLGSGSHGEIYLGVNLTTMDQVAIKVLSKPEEAHPVLQYIRHEVEIMRQIHHPNIVEFIDILETHNHVYIVMEYCAGGDVDGYIRRTGFVEESQARCWLQQILLALEALQQHRVIHRDIKTANILLATSGQSSVAKLGDFGFARTVARSGEPMSYLGTPLYMSPELVNNQIYDHRSDVWSFGVVAYEMLVGCVPFRAKNMIELREFQQQPVVFPPALSPVAKDLLRLALTVRANERPLFSQLLQHPFFHSGEGPVPEITLNEAMLESATTSELLERETLQRDFVRVELEETLNQREFYWRKKKLAGLAILYGVVENFRRLFAELEELRLRFTPELVAANHDFADLYHITQRHIVFNNHEYAALAQKLKQSPEPSAQAKYEMGCALLEQVRKQAKSVKNKPERIRAVVRALGVVIMLLPHNQEPESIRRALAEQAAHCV